MENTPRLYHTLVEVLSQPPNWLDRRHLKTLAWMTVGLIKSGLIPLTAWAPYVVSRARYFYRGRGIPLVWLDQIGLEQRPRTHHSIVFIWRSGS
jgi:hypothetical protein